MSQGHGLTPERTVLSRRLSRLPLDGPSYFARGLKNFQVRWEARVHLAGWRVSVGRRVYLHVFFIPPFWPLPLSFFRLVEMCPENVMGMCLIRYNPWVSASVARHVSVCVCCQEHACKDLCVPVPWLAVNPQRLQSPGLWWLLFVSSGQPKGQYPVRWSKLHFLSSAIAFPIPSPNCS